MAVDAPHPSSILDLGGHLNSSHVLACFFLIIVYCVSFDALNRRLESFLHLSCNCLHYGVLSKV